MSLPAIKAPFPYFGGKSKIAPAIWARLGDVRNYVEPFCGSAAMLLGAPVLPRVMTLNDADGYLINFYRAVQADPSAVATWLNYPVSEVDLFARHVWLLRHKDTLAERLMCDTDFFDTKIAGWWCWGLCAWIGDAWCSGNGPWSVEDGAIVHVRNGVRRKLPHLSTAGRGVHRQLPDLGTAGRGVHRQQHLNDYMHTIAERLRSVRLTCGDWRRVLSPAVTVGHGLTAIMLDPPYGEGAMDYAAGGNDTADIARDVRAWAVEHGTHPLLRIAVCGYADGWVLPDGWTALPWKARKGYQTSTTNSHREVVWFSPHCLPPSLATP